MAKYLFEARYTLEGGKGVAREGGTGRRAAVAKMAEGMGGKLESFYFGFATSTPTSSSICPTTRPRPPWRWRSTAGAARP